MNPKLIAFLVFIAFGLLIIIPKLIMLICLIAAVLFIAGYGMHMSNRIKTGKNTVYLKTKRNK